MSIQAAKSSRDFLFVMANFLIVFTRWLPIECLHSCHIVRSLLWHKLNFFVIITKPICWQNSESRDWCKNLGHLNKSIFGNLVDWGSPKIALKWAQLPRLAMKIWCLVKYLVRGSSSPSLVQKTSGVGSPTIFRSNLTRSPAMTVTSCRFLASMYGATVNDHV